MSTPNLIELKETIKSIQCIIKTLDRKGITDPKQKEDYFWKNHVPMMKSYPFLVTQLCNSTDTHMLTLMLRQLELVEIGEMTTDEASTVIGTKLANKYLPD